MPVISDDTSNGFSLVANGSSKLLSERNSVEFALKSKLRPEGTNSIRFSDHFGSIFDVSADTVIVGTPAHRWDASGANQTTSAGAAWIFERTVRPSLRNRRVTTRRRVVFNYTGDDQFWTVPEYVDRVTVQLIGAGGGGSSNGNKGGNGAYVKATIPVSAGRTYKIIVGEAGQQGGTNRPYGGGGCLLSPGGIGGSGGGRSAFSDEVFGDILTAGAGGGAGKDGDGGHGGLNGKPGIAVKTGSHSSDRSINAGGAEGFMIGKNEAIYYPGTYTLVGTTRQGYLAGSTTYNTTATIQDDNWWLVRHQGEDAQSAAIQDPARFGSFEFGNGAGGAGAAGGAAGPDAYGYRAGVGSNFSYFETNGSGAGGSSLVEQAPGVGPYITDFQAYTDVVVMDGDNRSLSDELSGYGLGGVGTSAGSHGIVIIEWDEHDFSTEEPDTRWEWTQTAKLIPTGTNARNSGDNFGAAVSVYGEWAVVGAPNQDYDASGSSSMTNAGAIYVFRKVDGEWTQQQKIVPSDRAANDQFGYTVELVGERMFVGAPGHSLDSTGSNPISGAGAVYVYELDSGVWTQTGKLTASGVNSRIAGDNFGYVMAISPTGNSLAVASKNGYDASGTDLVSGSGNVYLFEMAGSLQFSARWAEVRVENAGFGSAISLRDNLVSIESANSTRSIFEKKSLGWEKTFESTDSNDHDYLVRSNFGYESGIAVTGYGTTHVGSQSGGFALTSPFNHSGEIYSLGLNGTQGFWATGPEFLTEENFTWEQWILVREPLPATSSIPHHKQRMPLVRRPGYWGFWLNRRAVEANGGEVYFEALNGSFSTRFDFGVVQRRTWTHLALVKEQNQIRTYVNGELRNTYDVTGFKFADAATNITWGYNPSIDSLRCPQFSVHTWNIRKRAVYHANFTPDHSSKYLPVANNARGRGTSTYVLDSNTVLSGLPTSYTDLSVKHHYLDVNDASTQHVEDAMENGGQVEILSKLGDNWTTKETPIVVPGYLMVRQSSTVFGKSVFVDDERLIIAAPGSNTGHFMGNQITTTTGKAYIFDTKNNFEYVSSIVPTSRYDNANYSRLFGNWKFTYEGVDYLVDGDYFDRHLVYAEDLHSVIVSQSYERTNVNSRIFKFERSGRITGLHTIGSKLLSTPTVSLKNVVYPNSYYANTSSSSDVNLIYNISYNSVNYTPTFGVIEQPLYLHDGTYYISDADGNGGNPVWDYGAAVSSGNVAKLVYNEETLSYDREFSIIYPGSYHAQRSSDDYFGYRVVTDGTSVWVSQYGSDKQEFTNGGGNSNRGGIERFDFIPYKQGWDETLWIPGPAISNGQFGISFDVKGDWLVARGGTGAKNAYVYKKDETGNYSLVSTHTLDDALAPYTSEMVSFFGDSEDVVVGSPDFSNGTKTNSGFVSFIQQNEEGDDYVKDETKYVPIVPIEGRYAGENFGAAIALNGTKVAIGAPGYSRTNNDTGTLNAYGGSYVFAKDTDTGYWNFSQVLKNETGASSNTRFGTKIKWKGDLFIQQSTTDNNNTVIAVYRPAMGVLVWEANITGSGRGTHGADIVDGDKLIAGETNASPATGYITPGAWCEITHADSTWTRQTSHFTPLHTNGSYENGSIVYDNYSNVALARHQDGKFGSSILLSDDKGLLYVGSPGHLYREDPYSGVSTNAGAVFAYYWDENTAQYRLLKKQNDPSVFTSQVQFGTKLHRAGDDVIAYSQTSSNNHGRIAKLEASGSGLDATISATEMRMGSGSEQYGFGLAYDEERGLYYVGSPTRNSGDGVGASGGFATLTSTGTHTPLNIQGAINNRNPYDVFGYSVALWKNKLAIGAPGYDYNEEGTVFQTAKGAVFIMERNSDSYYGHVQKITYQDEPGSRYGSNVGINDDILFAQSNTHLAKILASNGDGTYSVARTISTPTKLSMSSVSSDSQTLAHFDPATSAAFVARTNSEFNLPIRNSLGGVAAIVPNGDDTWSTSEQGIYTPTYSANGIMEYTHTITNYTSGFGENGLAFSPDGTMLAVAAPNDSSQMYENVVYTTPNVGKIFIYRWDQETKKFLYHSYIINPVGSKSNFGTDLSWSGNILSVTQEGGSVYNYELIDDYYWRLKEIYTQERNTTRSVLTNNGNALVTSSPFSTGYPYVIESGAVNVLVRDEFGRLWSAAGARAGADAPAYGSSQTSGGGGGAGYKGGRAGGSTSYVTNDRAVGGEGGTNLVPEGFIEIISSNYARPNGSDPHAAGVGAGASANAADGEHGRIVIIEDSVEYVYDYTGFDQFHTVGEETTEITVKMWGAGGGAGTMSTWNTTRSSRGGAGGYIEGDLAVVPGETLKIMVGAGGTGGIELASEPNRNKNRRYGFGGVGGFSDLSYVNVGGCGGGLSAILRDDEYVAIAGGGGGGTSVYSISGWILDGMPAGRPQSSDVASLHLLTPGYELVVAPGLINTRFSNDLFGLSVTASSNNELFVGAPGHRYSTDGDKLPENSGTVFHYRRMNNNWDLVQRINATTPASNRYFGSRVAYDHGNDRLVAIGGNQSWSYDMLYSQHFSISQSRVEVFDRIEDTNNFVVRSIDYFNSSADEVFSVAFHDNHIITGTPQRNTDGVAAVVNLSGGFVTWDMTTGNLTRLSTTVGMNITQGRNSGDYLGESVAIVGNDILLGAPGHDFSEPSGNERSEQGAVLVFTKKANTYSFNQKITLDDASTLTGFGSTLRVIGDKVYVGTSDKANLFELVRNGEKFAINKQMTVGSNKIAVAYTQEELIELDPNGSEGIGNQPNVTEAGLAKIFTIGADGTLTYADKKFAVPGGSQGRVAGDLFGSSIYNYNDFVVVGSPTHNRDEFGNIIDKPGAMFVFKRTGNNWNQEIKLVADEEINTGIGHKLAGRNGWVMTSGSLDDESTVRIYQRVSEGEWVVRKDFTGDQADLFGDSLAAASTTRFVIGSPGADGFDDLLEVQNSGIVGTVLRDGTTWTEVPMISARGLGNGRNAGDHFGYALDATKHFVVVGVPNYAFGKANDEIVEGAGSIYVYRRDGDIYENVARVVSPDRTENGLFGATVGIDTSTNKIAVGEPGANRVHVFTFDGENVELEYTIEPELDTDEVFGQTVAFNAGFLAVGCALASTDADDDNELEGAGAVRVFKWNSSTTEWEQIQKYAGFIDANGDPMSNHRNVDDFFGKALWIDEKGSLIVGVPGHDYNREGVDMRANAGAAYIRKLP